MFFFLICLQILKLWGPSYNNYGNPSNKIDFGWSDQTNPNLSYFLMIEDGLDRPSEVKENILLYK